MLLTSVNGLPAHLLEAHLGALLRDGQPVGPLTVTQTDPHAYTVVQGGRSYRVLVLGFDPDTYTLRLQVNGKPATVTLKDRQQLYAERIGVNGQATKKLLELRAPMPGLVRALHVAVGQVVQKGDPLVTLEAMKMENVLKATAEGTVTALHATQDAAVEKGVLLISFS